MKPIWDRLNVELLLTQAVSWLPSLFAAVLILVGFYVLFRITTPTLRRVLAGTGLENALIGMLIGVYRFGVLTFGVIMAASQLGINVGAALAGLGVVGLTIGFAAKDSLSNIMAGFLIFWDKPFHVGDWVTLCDHYGEVAEITMRTTRVRTRANTWVIIPNETVINQILVNHSTNGRTRVEVAVGIGYDDDIGKARRTIVDALAGMQNVLKDPPPKVVVKNLGASTVDLSVFAWVAEAKDERPTQFQIIETIKLALDAAQVEMPYPTMQLHIKTPDSEDGALAQPRDRKGTGPVPAGLHTQSDGSH
jgi:small conductance mechanosensitive channel